MLFSEFKNEKIKKSENIFKNKKKYYIKKMLKKFYNKIKKYNIFQNIKHQFNLKLLISPLCTKRFKTQNGKQV